MLSLTEILVVITVLNGCFWGLVWGMARLDGMENNTVLSKDAELIETDGEEMEVEVPVKKAYEDDNIIIEDI
tara:strand:+ start:155 stop:370 length:216 start_codon:yes stop_codon:yes gene_type:complete